VVPYFRALADLLCEQISKLAETSYVVMVAGSYDIHVEVICRDNAHFTEFLTDRLQVIGGVVSTESLFVLAIYKLAYGWGVGEAVGAHYTEDMTEQQAALEPTNRTGR